MAEALDSPAPALMQERYRRGEKAIARVLRTGALASGALFFLSLVIEALSVSQKMSTTADVLRKCAASLLLATPVARLLVAGTTLGLAGERKYALYSACVLGMLAMAIRAGFSA